MEKREIRDDKDPLYTVFREIYNYSFPIYEQRTDSQQNNAFVNPAYHLEIKTEENMLLSFISYWEFENYIYIEHLAVNKDFRGNNIGSALLKDFTKEHTKIVLLEIDPLTDQISRKRFEFYKRNGFIANPYPHFHPPYRQEYKPHELIVLSHGQSLNKELYEEFNSDLKNRVMKGLSEN